MSRFLVTLIIFGLTSCLSSKYPTELKRFEGIVMSCRADSNTIRLDNEIKIKRIIQSSATNCINCKYAKCNNPPEYYDFVIHWPGEFIFNFNKKEYVFLNNSRPFHPEIKYGEKGFNVQYDLDFGSINFNKKDKSIILISTKYNVTRVFNYIYSKQDSILTLTTKY